MTLGSPLRPQCTKDHDAGHVSDMMTSPTGYYVLEVFTREYLTSFWQVAGEDYGIA